MSGLADLGRWANLLGLVALAGACIYGAYRLTVYLFTGVAP